jgi:hypothetical protein
MWIVDPVDPDPEHCYKAEVIYFKFNNALTLIEDRSKTELGMMNHS